MALWRLFLVAQPLALALTRRHAIPVGRGDVSAEDMGRDEDLRGPWAPVRAGQDQNVPASPVPPGAGEEPGLDIVWSSPVQTGSGWQSNSFPNAGAGTSAVAAALPEESFPSRHLVAFESDLLDNAFVHWEQESPTLEMIPGHKKSDSAVADSVPVETLMSTAGALAEPAAHRHIEPVRPGAGAGGDGVLPFDPDLSQGAVGPAAVRKDGIEDPRRGWRPTGLVFFETLTTPPRGIVYSSNMSDAFLRNRASAGAEGAVPADGERALTGSSAAESKPFFDFPDSVPAAPAEETQDHPVKPIVVKVGGGGGGGSSFFLRFMFRLFILGLAAVGLLLCAALGAYGWYAQQRIYKDSPNTRAVLVTITPGETFRGIINGMKKDGLLGSFFGLDDRYLMRYLAYFYDDSEKIKPGMYRFTAGQNLDAVYRKLIEGSQDYKVTIPEGKTAAEVGEIVAKHYSSFDKDHFVELVNSPDFAHSLGVDAPTLEGYLYPSTYYVGPGMKEEELARLMVTTFQKKVEGIQDKMTTRGLTLHQHVIMGSLIEREARMDEDRPLIASVIFNRLEQGMPLQIDATVNYALNDWRRLFNSDYQIDHPYNTYKFKGLPPGPITSPRIESLLATYTAPETNYLYYVHMGNGRHAFAESYAQHEANVGRYIRQRDAGLAAMPAATPSENERGVTIRIEPGDASQEMPEAAAETKENQPVDTGEVDAVPGHADEDMPAEASVEEEGMAEESVPPGATAEATPAPKSY